jgi:acyl-CoA synthetase (AMP-forming)/AMP-acid ligase II
VLQGLLELIDRDPASPLIHADAEREAVSYGQLLRDVRAFASGLGGVDRSGDGAAWVAVHDPYLLLVGVLGALGVVSCAMVETTAGPADCDQMAASGEPGVVICDDPGSPVCAWARARGVPVTGVDLTAGGGAATPPDGGGERCLRFFTSGSTGVPKCVGLALPQLRAALRGVARTISLGPEDVSLSTAPLSHTLGLVTTVLVAWASGGSVVFADLARPRALEAAVSGARPTWCAASPALLRLLLRLAAARDLDWSSLRLLRSASSPLTLELARGLEARFEVPVVNAYVMTEAPGEIASQGLDRHRRPGTVGQPPGCPVEIRNAGAEAVGASGEVWIRGPNVAVTAGPSGWLRTGDLGVLDESGLLTITGRRDDIINQGGLKIWPPDLEAAALQHAKVRAAVAFPIPHEGLGEVVGLVVEPRPGQELDRSEVRRFLMDRVARQKWPSTIVVCDSIPLNRRGKIPRRRMWQLLRDRL